MSHLHPHINQHINSAALRNENLDVNGSFRMWLKELNPPPSALIISSLMSAAEKVFF